MKIIRRDNTPAGPAEPPTARRTDTFTGTVYGDPVLEPTDGASVTSVFFAPGGRTYWHSHENGQVLHVVEGRGLVATKDDAPQPIGAGDVIWAPPGEVHWHGGSHDSMVLHLAVSLGPTTWLAEVTNDEYGTRS